MPRRHVVLALVVAVCWAVNFVDVFEYTGDPNNPAGDLISETLSGLHGPHPDLLSDFSAHCDVLVPYLQGP